MSMGVIERSPGWSVHQAENEVPESTDQAPTVCRDLNLQGLAGLRDEGV